MDKKPEFIRFAEGSELFHNRAPTPASLREAVLANKNFYRVLYTTISSALPTDPRPQMVAMYLKPGESIGWEYHPEGTQTFILYDGSCTATQGVPREPADLSERTSAPMVQGDVWMVEQNTYHDVTANSSGASLLAIYSWPHHEYDEVKARK